MYNSAWDKTLDPAEKLKNNTTAEKQFFIWDLTPTRKSILHNEIPRSYSLYLDAFPFVL